MANEPADLDGLVDLLESIDRGGVLHAKKPARQHPVCAKAATAIRSLRTSHAQLAAAAEEMATALEGMMPNNMPLIPAFLRDDQEVPLDVKAGELRNALSALTTYRNLKGHG